MRLPKTCWGFARVQLFVDRAQAVRPGFEVTPGNARVVAAVCARLEGIPLALELASAWAQTLTPAQMLAHLDRRLDLLTSRRRDLPTRHQSLRAALASSYQLLTPSQQQFFARLSVFRGGWTLPAAEAVCQNSGDSSSALEYLTQLRERSLILAEESGDEMRFRMLDTVREYAAEQLSAEEQALLAHRHINYFVGLAEVAEPKLRGAEQSLWLARLEAEHDNLRAVLERPEGEPESVLRLAGALGRFWLVRGYWSEGREWLRKGLAKEKVVSASTRAKALSSAAALAWVLDAYDEAKALCEESLNLYREQHDLWGIAFSLALAGTVAVRQGEQERATEPLEESLAQFRAINDPWGIAYALNQLASIARDKERYEQAAALYEESLALRRELEDEQGIAVSLSNLADAAQLQGDWVRAALLHEESLERFQALGDKAGTAYSLGKRGDIALHQGNSAQADLLHRESLALFWEIRDKRRIAECLERIAGVCAARGQGEKAARLFGAANNLREAIGAPLTPGERTDLERGLSHAREALGAEAFARAWELRRAMTLEEAVADALEAGETSA